MNRFIFKGSKAVAQAYHSYCKERNVKRLKGEIDMPIRWNSTYKMIKRLLKQRVILSSFFNLYNTTDAYIFDKDWDLIVNLVELFEVFFESTTRLSGVYYPTSCLVLPQMGLIFEKLSEYKDQNAFKSMISEMTTKLLKYFEKIPPIFSVAAALNPIINKEGVLNIISLIEDYVGSDKFSADENITLFEESFENLFRYYKALISPPTTQTQNINVGASSKTSSKSFFGLINKQFTKRVKSSTNPIDELSGYCSIDFSSRMTSEEFDSFDILEWWKNRKNDYPVLAAMARDLLTVQASTVASESAFSTSGRVITDRRTKLNTESVKVCICLKDYLDSVDRTQHINALDLCAIDQLEEDLLIGSEQTSYTSGNEDFQYNSGSNDPYFSEMSTEGQAELIPETQPQMQPQIPNFDFLSFYNTEDLFNQQQSRFRPNDDQ